MIIVTRKSITRTALIVVSWLAATNVYATDVEGSSDHPMISRFPGSSIYQYGYRDFDEYKLPVAVDAVESKELEGKVTKIWYTSKTGDSSAQVFRSYGSALNAAGFENLFECKLNCGGGIRLEMGKFEGPGALGDDCRYKSARLARDAGDVYVSLLVCDWYGSDSVATFLHVIEAESLEGGLITVNAEQLQEEILQQGHTVLYGIYFDTNKSELKTESQPALDEVSRLLYENSNLHILVVGHTDNVGELGYNVSLSQKRAQAVINALVNRYGIESSRLSAFGAGMYAPVASNRTKEGRALNRRVELVER